MAIVEVDRVLPADVGCNDIHVLVAVDIGQGDGACVVLATAKRGAASKVGVPVIKVDHVGLLIPVGHDQVNMTIAIHVTGCHGNGGIGSGPEGPRFGEVPLSVVEVENVLSAPVCDHDIDMLVTVQVGQRHVARRLRLLGQGSGCWKSTLGIVEPDQAGLAVVTDDQVQVAIAIQVCQRNGIATVGILAERDTVGKPPLAIVWKPGILRRPMPAIGHDDIEMVIAVKITDANRGGFQGEFPERDVTGELSHWWGRPQVVAGADSSAEGKVD